MVDGLVSIIMPSWNTGNFIAESIQSVLNQTYTKWELIIVDDCSSDNTDEIVSLFKDDRIRFFHNIKNSGAALTRNKALREDRIKFLNKYHIRQDKKILLFAGRLCKDKGIEAVIECAKKLDGLNCVLVIVGANFYSSGIISPYEEYLKKLSAEIKGNIIFTGYVDYCNMAYIYNMADEKLGLFVVQKIIEKTYILKIHIKEYIKRLVRR